jgi:hypothetical protein
MFGRHWPKGPPLYRSRPAVHNPTDVPEARPVRYIARGRDGSMSIPTHDAFRNLLARSGLVDQASSAACRAVFEASADAATAARRLVAEGLITTWQAQRLLAGRAGPFFLGDWRLLARHEFPGPARAFSARHEPTGRLVNLVWLDRRRCEDADAWQELVRRTTVASRIRSPVVSRTWALEQVTPPGRGGDERIIVCERVQGELLADELVRLGPLPPVDAATSLHAIATAVAELHAAGVVHGDLSLDAVVREPGEPPRSGRVRLLQFPVSGDPHRRSAGPPVDTAEEVAALGRRACFVPPERLAAGRDGDVRGDVYALGCMIQAAVTGRLPGWNGDPRATLEAARRHGPSPEPELPPEIAALVAYCTAVDPQGRYPTAAHVADAIAVCFGLEPEATATVARGAPPVSTPTPRRSRPRRRLSTEAWLARVLVGMVGVFLAVMLGLTIRWRSREPPRRPAAPPGVAEGRREGDPAPARTEPPAAVTPAATDADPADPAAGPRPATAGVAPAGPQVEIVSGPDAVTLPWRSPTSGPPPTVRYGGPGSQALLFVRLAEMEADPEGRRVLQAVGPHVEPLLARLEQVCGWPASAVELLQVGWQTGTDPPVDGVVVVTLVPGHTIPDDAGFREQRWGVTARTPQAGDTVHAGRIGSRDVDVWVPAAAGGRVLVIAGRGRAAAIVAAVNPAEPDAAMPLPPPVEQVLRMLDGSRHVTLVGMPAFLRAAGRTLFAGFLEPLREPLLDLLGDGVEAAAVSWHCGRDFYAELDLVTTRDVHPQRLAADLRAALERVPDTVEDVCVQMPPGTYGRRLVLRLPAMLRVLVANLRAGAEGRGVVANTRLPAAAAHNIALAAELALGRFRGGIVAEPAAPPPEPAAARLRRRIDLGFARDTLARAVELLAEEVGVPIRIRGDDLERAGITQNQSFALDETDQQAEAVLRSILSKADPAGSLVWVLRDRDGVEWVEITTREAAAARGDAVPAAATVERP